MSLAADQEAIVRTPAQRSWRAFLLHHWEGIGWGDGDATPFQRSGWLNPLYAAIATHERHATPFVLRLEDAHGRLALQLPLLARRLGRMTVIEFADLGMTDFNGPLLGAAAPVSINGAAEAWTILRAALPPHDLVNFTKMPATIAGRDNPLALLKGGHLSALNGNLLEMADSWEDFHFGLAKHVRKELERSWRVFLQDSRSRYQRITDKARALALLGEMGSLQRARMADLGQPYHLDDPVTADFNRRVIGEGVVTGAVVLTALINDGELVAGLAGRREGNAYIMFRLAHAAGEWGRISPGRLLIHKTLEQLHGEGVRDVDFSIGNYAYKRRFGPRRVPLFDYVEAASPKGMPHLLRAKAGAFVRRYPRLRTAARQALGKPPLREEY